MGRNIHTKHVDDELDNFNPSCMWGIIHAIDYHHWRYNVKRLLPHRKNQGTHAKGKLLYFQLSLFLMVCIS